MISKLSTAALQLAFAAVLIATAKCQTYPRIVHGERVLANNSYIYLEAIGEGGENALKCVTDIAYCCGYYWYDEQGQEVQFEENGNATFYITARDREISLNRRNGHSGGSIGLWLCDIPDTSGVRQSLYIYIGTYIIGKCVYDY